MPTTITKDADAVCGNCLWYLPHDTARGDCHFYFPREDHVVGAMDMCPNGRFLVKHRHYGYMTIKIPDVVKFYTSNQLIEHDDLCINQILYQNTTNETPGWCDK